MPKRSDRALLDAARHGSVPALEELLARHEKAVYRFGLRMCRNEEDARDVLQETLLAAFKGIHHFRAEAALSTWLYQVAKSFCIKVRRRAAATPAKTVALESAAARDVASDEPAPDVQAHAREVAAVLEAAISSLSPAHREVILLRDVEGLTAQEAAAELRLDVPALKSRLHRARTELRRLLAPNATD